MTPGLQLVKAGESQKAAMFTQKCKASGFSISRQQQQAGSAHPGSVIKHHHEACVSLSVATTSWMMNACDSHSSVSDLLISSCLPLC